jgi:hypothetical protein
VVSAGVERLVRQRAGDRCEYCLLPQTHVVRTFHVDHVLAVQHLSDDSPDNLALACHRCNAFKGPNIAGVDPVTRAVTRLFNPRTDAWNSHFAWRGGTIVGLTDIGNVTIHVLKMNERSAVRLRVALMSRKLFFLAK